MLFLACEFYFTIKYFPLSIFFPSKNNSSAFFEEYLDSLKNVIYEYSWKGKVILMGDFNCHTNSNKVKKTLDLRDKVFSSFLRQNGLSTVTSLDLCSGPHLSFFNRNCGRSLIDNIIFNSSDAHSITSCNIVDDESLLYSNHRAIQCSLTVPTFGQNTQVETGQRSINWSKSSLEQREKYKLSLDNDLGLEALLRHSLQTTKDIDFVYTALVNALYNTGNLCIPAIPYKPYLKPYWCSGLTTLNKTMKSIRREWLQSGSSRDSPLFKKLKYSITCSSFTMISIVVQKLTRNKFGVWLT